MIENNTPEEEMKVELNLDDGSTVMCEVITILEVNGKEYVVESGLQVGEEIISEGAGLVKEGAEVKGK